MFYSPKWNENALTIGPNWYLIPIIVLLDNENWWMKNSNKIRILTSTKTFIVLLRWWEDSGYFWSLIFLNLK